MAEPTRQSNAPVTHIAGTDLNIGGQRLRQRCAWCGAILIDYDLTHVASDRPGPPATWPVDELVRVDGSVSAALDYTEHLPADACSRLDDEVTR